LCLEEDEQIWRKLQEDVGGCPTAGHVGPPGPHDKVPLLPGNFLYQLNVASQFPVPLQALKAKKRSMPRPDTDEDPPRVAESKMSLEIGNEEAVSGVYKQFFESIPQAACKEIAKALVELMTPEKCTNGAALGWWPKELNDLDYLSNKGTTALSIALRYCV
jgi:hypothetical protein